MEIKGDIQKSKRKKKSQLGRLFAVAVGLHTTKTEYA